MVDFSRIAGGWESPEWVIFELPALVRFVLPDAPPGAAYPAYGEVYPALVEARSKSRLNKTYTKNIDLRHIFALYRKLATVKEVLL
ncbi:hypothetical protein [Escherichia coli]|nr:hypothetical protein [Escherichia coli]